MKRPGRLTTRALLVVLALVVGQYLALAWLVPHPVMRAVERAAGGRLLIGRARLRFPFTTTLAALRLVNNTEAFALSAQRVTITPRWVWFPSKTLWLKSLEIERPLVRVTRTQAGTLLWPTLQPAAADASAVSSALLASWTIHVDSISVVDASLELIDETVAPPFHGLMDHLSIEMGPLTISRGDLRAPHPSARQGGLSVAGRGQVVGYLGQGAPLYCSGWLDPWVKDLQASCQLAPIPLAAFEPYYSGPAEVRVYAATLKATTQLSAKANQFTGRIQLELNNLAEGDLSVRGRTIIDVKRLTAGQEPRLSGEMYLAGALDDPGGWHVEFLPGDERVQHLVRRLLDRGVEVIRLALWGHYVRLSLTPASQATMMDIETASREVEEALEILAGPPPAETPASSGEAATPSAVITPGIETVPESAPPVSPAAKTEAPPADGSRPQTPSAGTADQPLAPVPPPAAPPFQDTPPTEPPPSVSR